MIFQRMARDQNVAIVVALIMSQLCLLPFVVVARPFQSRIAAAMALSSSSSTTPIPPPPPISMPVWALAAPILGASATTEQETSMCIVTLTSAVSVAPPKLWIVSLYRNTLTKHSFLEAGRGVLQLLTPKHKELVSVLGKRSGYEENYSKRDECAKFGLPWGEYANSRTQQFDFLSDDTSTMPTNLDLLPGCAAYIHVKMRSLFEAGDHEVALSEVVGTGVWNENLQEIVPLGGAPLHGLDHETVLYTGELRRDGII